MTSEKPQIDPAVVAQLREQFLADSSAELQEQLLSLAPAKQLQLIEKHLDTLGIQQIDFNDSDSPELTVDTIKLIGKQPDSISNIEQLHAQLVENALGVLPPENHGSATDVDMDDVRAFANADLNDTSDLSALQEHLLKPCKAMDKPLDEYMQAMLATHLAGLHKASKLLERLMREHILVHNNQARNEAILQIQHNQLNKEQAQTTGAQGGRSRHAKDKELKALAIELYQSHNYPSPRAAAKRMAPQVLEKADEIGRPVLNRDDFWETIYRWIRKYKA